MAVVSTTTVYRGLKAFSNTRNHPRSLILGLAYACTTDASVVFGTDTFSGSENQAASIIGHELVHAALGWFAGECPAYQWEADHAFGTGTIPCDADYITDVLRYLADSENNCP